jgi:hypothetical protein
MAIMDPYAALRRLTPLVATEKSTGEDRHSDGWAEFDLTLSAECEKKGIELDDLQWTRVLAFFREPNGYVIERRCKKKKGGKADVAPPPDGD